MNSQNEMEDLDDILFFAVNKLNVKNAFDVSADFIKTIPDLIKDGGQEESWAKTSEVIAAGSKIYGFRVDNINKNVHSLLNGFHRTNTELLDQEEEAKEEEMEEEDRNKQKANRRQKIENQGEVGLSTLEKEDNVSADFSSFTSNIDVGFHQLTEQYDTSRLGSMLLNTLNVSSF